MCFSINILHQFFLQCCVKYVIIVSFLHFEGCVTCCVVQQHICSTTSLLQFALRTICIAILYGATAVEQRRLNHIMIQEPCSLCNLLQSSSASCLLQATVTALPPSYKLYTQRFLQIEYMSVVSSSSYPENA